MERPPLIYSNYIIISHLEKRSLPLHCARLLLAGASEAVLLKLCWFIMHSHSNGSDDFEKEENADRTYCRLLLQKGFKGICGLDVDRADGSQPETPDLKLMQVFAQNVQVIFILRVHSYRC